MLYVCLCLRLAPKGLICAGLHARECVPRLCCIKKNNEISRIYKAVFKKSTNSSLLLRLFLPLS